MPTDSDAGLTARLQKWADGKATLKDVRGYSDEELFSLSLMANFLYRQGKVEEARKMYQGLYAVNPMEPAYAKALGVVEMAAGNPDGALAAYDVALKIVPKDPEALVGRAEVNFAKGNTAAATNDLRRAADVVTEPTLKAKISAMLAARSK